MSLDQFKEFVIKDSVTVEGITEDYLWYHAKLLQEKMTHWQLDFQKLVGVMESRHQDQLKMLQSVMDENRELKKQLKEKNNA
jgi:hypothetical protein